MSLNEKNDDPSDTCTGKGTPDGKPHSLRSRMMRHAATVD